MSCSWSVSSVQATLARCGTVSRRQYKTPYEVSLAGKWRSVVEVAIKSMKEHAMSKKAFLDEAEIMKKCYHPNLGSITMKCAQKHSIVAVRLFAVCTTSEPFYIITEYMCNGSLLSYLRGAEGSSLPQNALIEFCAMVSCIVLYCQGAISYWYPVEAL